MNRRLRAALTGAAMAAALSLTACNNGQSDTAAALPALPATLPLAPGYAGQPAYAPVARALPDAPALRPVRLANPRQTYAYADDAWGFDDALGDAPPDYGFYYDDVEPWAWEGYDQSLAFVEPLEDGYRYYYYRPGEDEPYFIRDPDWGYGYDHGQLAAVYGPDWQAVPYYDYGPRLSYASRYYVRGRDLYRASRQRHPVIVGNWMDRQQSLSGDHVRWAQERAQRPAWQDYHMRTAAQQTRYWSQERARRRADEVRFAAWRAQDFRTPPPPRAIPAAWTRADWARDQRRFAPPAKGFAGDLRERQQAAEVERARFARETRRAEAQQQRQALASARPQAGARPSDFERIRPDRPAFRPGPAMPQGAAPTPDLRAQREAARNQRQAERETRLAARRPADMRAAQPEGTRQQRVAAREQAQAMRGVQRDRRDANAQADARRIEVQQRQQAQRQQAEQRRQQAAQARAEGEQRRSVQAQASQRAEQRRAEAEQRRAAQSQARAQAEQRRSQQTQARAQAEQRRAEQAQVRAQSEQRRQQADARRQEQVQARAQAQQARQQAVQARQQAVQARQAQRQQADAGGGDRGAQRAAMQQQRAEARDARRAERGR